jgi:NitT/TauT family transport system permease protein
VKTLRASAFLVVLILIWEALARAGFWDRTLIPAPGDVAQFLWSGISDHTLIAATATTMRRVLIGYAISLMGGIPLGIVLARFRFADDTMGALVTGLQALPSMCWIPFAIICFGLSDNAILFVVVMGSLVSITVSVRDGVANLPPTYIRAARTLGTRRLAMVTEVLLPASLPSLITGAKLGWAYAWRALMAGELLIITPSLGSLLKQGGDNADMVQVIAAMVIIVVIGLGTDFVVFGALEKMVRRRFGLARA